ncbi:hypothetical protein ADL26_07280 [Thermoactinomyces vulgaris]|jgi:ABC-type multidrug transport system fused ATPase/permease subunit|nr:hypothetical protein ADL26_07280 [Thermoactinomyces vulgaris]
MRSIKRLGIALLIIYLVVLTTAPLLYAILHRKETTIDQDLVANWISYLNFLMALIALLATVAGIVFTYNQFVQAKQLAKKIDETMKEKFNEWEERTDKKLKNMIKAYSLLIEQAIAEDAGKVRESRLSSLLEAEAAYPNLWGLKYFKALAIYYDAKEKQNDIEKQQDRELAITLMKEHIKDNNDHIKAYIFLLFWLLRQKKAHKALEFLEGLLEQKPEYCYELQLIKDEAWEESSSVLEDRNKILYLAEQKLYERNDCLSEFLDPHHTTRLETILKDLYRTKDPSLYSRAALLHLNKTS